jgi:SAM-dependent methyltransferase
MSADRVANEAGSRDAAVRGDGVAGSRGTDLDAMPVRPAEMENRLPDMTAAAERTIGRFRGLDWARHRRGWLRQVIRQDLRSVRRLLARAVGRATVHGQSAIARDYDRQWRKKTFERYQPDSQADGGGAWTWGRHRRFLLSNEGGAAVRLIYLHQALAGLDARSVLEVGCGNGLNLLLLACRFTDRTFAGVEFTRAGVRAGAAVARSGVLPPALQQFAPFAIADPHAVGRVNFVQGTGAALPFDDGAFDVVFTSLALEQMEEIRHAALRELARVASRYVVMLEPFADVNRTGSRRRYVRAHDYFQGAVGDLVGLGLEPVAVVTDMPHKAWLGTALVIARKQTAPQAAT